MKTEVLIPLKTKVGLNNREHWRTRHARCKNERTTAALLTRGWKVPAGQCAVIKLTRFHVAKKMDDDNLPGALKAIRDGIADSLGIDDGSPRLVWKYEQRKCPPGDFGVVAELII